MSTRTQIGVVPEELVTPVACDTQQRKVAAMALSLALRYPEEDFFSTLVTVEEQLGLLPAPVAAEISEFIGRAHGLGLLPLQEHYVETFDQRRRCALHSPTIPWGIPASAVPPSWHFVNSWRASEWRRSPMSCQTTSVWYWRRLRSLTPILSSTRWR